jgi:hypothetical protein
MNENVAPVRARACRAGPVTATARVALAGSATASQVSWAAGEAAGEAVAAFGRLLDPAFMAEADWDAAGRNTSNRRASVSAASPIQQTVPAAKPETRLIHRRC